MKLFSMQCMIPFALAAGLTLVPHAAHAQVPGLTFLFVPASQTVSMGGSANYTGQFTNTTTTDYFVTLGDYVPNSPGGSPLVTGFFNGDPNNGNSPFDVMAGKTLTISGVETLSADPSLGAGTYTGVVDFQGRTAADFLAGRGSDMTLSTAPITLIVSAPAVPEVSTTVSLSLLLMLGLAGAVVSARRRKAASAL